jgi:hypothetical protein
MVGSSSCVEAKKNVIPDLHRDDVFFLVFT